MIDSTSGDIEIGLMKLEPGISLFKLQDHEFWRSAKLLIDNAGWKTYLLEPFEHDNQKIGFSLVFENEKLDQVTFSIVTSSDKQSKQMNDKLLMQELGTTKGQYPWGEVSSVHDPRSGSMVIVSYRKGSK